MNKFLLLLFFLLGSCTNEYIIEDLSKKNKINVQLQSDVIIASNKTTWIITLNSNSELPEISENDLNLVNAQLADVTKVNNRSYEFTIVPNGNGLVEITLTENAKVKIFGDKDKVVDGLEVFFDDVSPDVTFNHSIAAITNSNSWSVDVALSEKLKGLATTDFNLVNCSISNITKINDLLYSLTISPNSEGAASINMAIGQVEDLAGNTSTSVTGISTVYDATSPNVTISNTPLVLISISNQSTYNLTGSCESSEGALSVDVGDQSFNPSCVSNVWFISDLSTVSDGTNLSVTVSQTDLAGNSGIASTTVTKDTTSPTVILTSSESSPSNESVWTITATFSEEVSNVDISDFLVTNATTSNFTQVSTSVYTIDVTPSSDGDVTVDMNAAAAQDMATYDSNAASQLVIEFDSTSPTVTLDALENINSSNQNSYTVSGTCSESDISRIVNITVGSINTTTVCNNNGAGNPGIFSISYDVSLLADSASVSVVAQITDAATNIGSDSALVVKNTTGPTVILTTTESNPSNNKNWSVTATFSEAPVGLDLYDFVVYNGAPTSLSLIDATTYQVGIKSDEFGRVKVGIASGSFTNSNSDPNSISNILELDFFQGSIVMPPTFGNSNTNIDPSMSFKSQLYNSPGFNSVASGFIKAYHIDSYGNEFIATDAGISITNTSSVGYFTQSSANYGLSSNVNDFYESFSSKFIIATENGIATSSDKASTWSVYSDNYDAVKNIRQASDGKIYAIGENNFYTSLSEFPISWSSVTNSSLGFSNPIDIAIDSSSNIVVITSDADKELYVSTNSGVSFSHISAGICPSSNLGAVEIDTNDELFVICVNGSGSGLYKLDGILSNPAVLASPSYKKLSALSGTDFYTLYVDAFNLYVSRSGVLAISKDRGDSWQEHSYGVTSGLILSDVNKMSKLGDKIYFYSMLPTSGIFYTDDAGDSFNANLQEPLVYSLPKDILSNAYFIDRNGSNIYYLSANNKLYKSNDNGASISLIDVDLPLNLTGLMVDSADNIYLRDNSSNLYKFDPVLETYQTLTTPFVIEDKIFLEDNNALWIKSNSEYARSNDGGANWSSNGAEGLYGYNEGTSLCDVATPNCEKLERIYKKGTSMIISNIYGFSTSLDNGASWNKFKLSDFTLETINDLYIDDFGNFYVVCNGLVSSSDGVNFNFVDNGTLNLSNNPKIRLLVSGPDDSNKVLHVIDESNYCKKNNIDPTFTCFDTTDGVSNQIKDFLIDENDEIKILTTSGIFIPNI